MWATFKLFLKKGKKEPGHHGKMLLTCFKVQGLPIFCVSCAKTACKCECSTVLEVEECTGALFPSYRKSQVSEWGDLAVINVYLNMCLFNSVNSVH